jgi:hypothetical protein
MTNNENDSALNVYLTKNKNDSALILPDQEWHGFLQLCDDGLDVLFGLVAVKNVQQNV